MNRIAELRKSKGLTLDEMQELTGINRVTISQYERGKREPKLVVWKKLADYFNVSIPFIQGISDNKRDFNNVNDVRKAGLDVNDLLFTASMSEFNFNDLKSISNIVIKNYPEEQQAYLRKVVDTIDERPKASVPLRAIIDAWEIALGAVAGDEISSKYLIKFRELYGQYREEHAEK